MLCNQFLVEIQAATLLFARNLHGGKVGIVLEPRCSRSKEVCLFTYSLKQPMFHEPFKWVWHGAGCSPYETSDS
jgi:hypothetical protein